MSSGSLIITIKQEDKHRYHVANMFLFYIPQKGNKSIYLSNIQFLKNIRILGQ
jgi:hypothetical protein